ncbi:hypothetical protein [Chromobacterium sphagni]|uniref:hypothetical protein n=1 Tax=Chromobacterium sphagni TaxID=1903179 RepID=UPI000ADEBE89|nr:hypothetical protein [Chromobacterium sphagni]
MLIRSQSLPQIAMWQERSDNTPSSSSSNLAHSLENVTQSQAQPSGIRLRGEVGRRSPMQTGIFNFSHAGQREGVAPLNGNAGVSAPSAGPGSHRYPIEMEVNSRWIDKQTRPACKYAPVVISKGQGEEAMKSMRSVEENRIETCRQLAMTHRSSDRCGWISFIRHDQASDLRFGPDNVPAIVISGGSANKIAQELGKDFSLAWHPMNMRNEPVYLLVHKMDYQTYAAALKEALDQYPNLRLVGWDGGQLTGFGAARAAATTLADSLPYRPERILMMDQDVVQTEGTRHSRPDVQQAVIDKHGSTGKPIIGYGVGYPTRQDVPKPFAATAKPDAQDFNSPAQQFVSIQAPFRERQGDGIYPAHMVAGGEDMLMGLRLGLAKDGKNTAILKGRIVKKELKGPADQPNAYWNKARVETLGALFESEKGTMVRFEGQDMTLDDLMKLFVRKQWLAAHPSPDSYNAAACVIERIILRLNKP